MDILDQIDALLQRAEAIIHQKERLQKAKLYSEGLKGKLRQTQFALHRLQEHVNQSDQVMSSTAREDFSIDDRVHFYCDSYWAFLLSSLDVLGQVMNQALRLGLDERDVRFKKVEETLKKAQMGTAVQKACTKCRSSHSYKNVVKYRNCSLHRRQIYIKETTSSVRETAGYDSATATGPTVSVERLVCDDPLTLKPKTNQRRRLPDYLEETREKIVKLMENILSAVQPTK